MESTIDNIPLVIDLDGTLLRSDLLLETILLFCKEHPHRIWQLLWWFMHGKVRLKTELIKSTKLDVSLLPYDSAVIEFIQTERKQGRKIVLATASHRILVEKIADHLQLFDEIIATDTGQNLAAHHKRDVLLQKFGDKGFDYAGNSRADIPVWTKARHAYVVNPELGVKTQAHKLGNVKNVLGTYKPTLRQWKKALRLHQWLKNALIFIPLLAAHRINELPLVLNTSLAFLLFGLCASSVYILNDLLDLNDDRHHPTKCRRPFAAGNISIKAGLITFPLLLITAFSGAIQFLPIKFVIVLAVYYAVTIAYSFVLKRWMIVDVITLAALYTLRIIAGVKAVELNTSFWMLAFSMFIFLSLALIKRYTELHLARKKGETKKLQGRGYYPSDLEMISSLGAASGYMSVLVLALYINDPIAITLYRYPNLIWFACPLLLLWISRVWMLTHRGHMHDDPVIFAIKDRASLIIGILFFIVFWFAI
jgi:4-hydroxybenzoate polyprenyltransferase